MNILQADLAKGLEPNLRMAKRSMSISLIFPTT
jgi:hypothetical protein